MTNHSRNDWYAGRMRYDAMTGRDPADDRAPERPYPRAMDIVFNQIVARDDFERAAFAHGYYGA